MVVQLPRPCVQYSGEADLSFKSAVTEFLQGLGCCAEQYVVDLFLIVPSQGIELVGQGEYVVEVVSIDDSLNPLLNPLGLSQTLAFWTVSVSARVVRCRCMAAEFAHFEMGPERCGPAVFDSPQDLQLLRAQRMVSTVLLSVSAEDVRDLQPRPLEISAGVAQPRRCHSSLPEYLAFFGPQ